MTDPYADSTLLSPYDRGYLCFLRGEACIIPRDLRRKAEVFERGFKFAGMITTACQIRARRRRLIEELKGR